MNMCHFTSPSFKNYQNRGRFSAIHCIKSGCWHKLRDIILYYIYPAQHYFVSKWEKQNVLWIIFLLEHIYPSICWKHLIQWIKLMSLLVKKNPTEAKQRIRKQYMYRLEVKVTDCLNDSVSLFLFKSFHNRIKTQTLCFVFLQWVMK